MQFGLRPGSEEGAPPSPTGEAAAPWAEIEVSGPVEEPAVPAAGEDAPEAAGDPPLLFDEEEVARICAALARRADREATEAAARREAELRSTALARFEVRLAELADAGDGFWLHLHEQLAEVIRGFAEAAVPMLVQRLGKEEVTAAVTGILERLGPEDRLEIRVSPDLAEDLSRLLPTGAGSSGTGTGWRVVADPEMTAGDFRIDRPHGFVERRADEICARIAEAVIGVLSPPDRNVGKDGAVPADDDHPPSDPAEE